MLRRFSIWKYFTSTNSSNPRLKMQKKAKKRLKSPVFCSRRWSVSYFKRKGFDGSMPSS